MEQKTKDNIKNKIVIITGPYAFDVLLSFQPENIWQEFVSASYRFIFELVNDL